MNNKIIKYTGIAFLFLAMTGCTIPAAVQRTENKDMPEGFPTAQDTTSSAPVKWREFFTDPNLIALIETALINNQEMNIALMEIEIAQNEIRARKGEYLPFVTLGAEGGFEKPGRFTSKGSSEDAIEIKPGKETPDPLQNYMIGAFASWELDVWKKLRNSKKAAAARYLATVEGRNFMITNLIAEIANAYYELLALDNELTIVKQNIQIQSNALAVVRVQKQSARVTELAVQRFEAQVFNTRSLQFGIQQQIVELENFINFLVGRFPQPITRDSKDFSTLIPNSIKVGIPSQLLESRPDVRQAEQNLMASKLDVKVARARFFPTIGITGGIGFQAFEPSLLFRTPESLTYSLVGELAAPLVNRNAIKATYKNANAAQIQAVYNYERTLLNAYIEVANQISLIHNLENTYNLKSQEVKALNQSVTISSNLFTSARADYMEVLLTQRDALESRFELIETKKLQMNAVVNIYRALGGGWN